MDWITVAGEDHGDIVLYALSTCGWCKKTKQFLDDLGVQYRYKYVDLAFGEEREQLLEEVRQWNARCSFPTLVLSEHCVVGYKPEEVKEVLGL